MALSTQRKRSALSIEAFRAFYASRPDEEHWELIDGVPMMMAPATFIHQRIASNLERLLNDALARHRSDWAAYQRGGLNLRPEVDHYDPEPDVVVIDVVRAPDQRYADRFYLAAEVVSDSDRATVDSKRDIYKLHPHCACILTVRQDVHNVRVDGRTGESWRVDVLDRVNDVLTLPAFGLRCAVGELYRGTPLAP